MGIVPLDEKYASEIYGVLHCYDRVIISGNLQPLCYAAGMTQYLYRHGIRIFDYGKQFAEPLRDAIRANAQRGPHRADSRDARAATRSGAYLRGHGTLSGLSALA
jgi:hypothetical protein